MNSFSFFYEHFGKHLSAERSNKPHMDASRVLRASYPLKGKPTPTRLAFGWAIIRPGKSSLKLNLDIAGITCDSRPESMSFLEELKKWDGTPRMFLIFGQAPIPIANLFLTLDLRAVRICSPKGTETFDFTKTPEETGSIFHRRLVNMDKKNAA